MDSSNEPRLRRSMPAQQLLHRAALIEARDGAGPVT